MRVTRQDTREQRETAAALEALRRHARAIAAMDDYAPLIDLAASARFALIGEASHGTHDFYATRAEITKHLIVEHGFTAVAVEADWPDAYRVNRYVRGACDDRDANAALAGFERFPGWMWRNTVARDFVEWLRQYNDVQPHQRKVGFYGLDLYSLFSSMQAVLEYLDRADPEAAKRARYRYSCFDHFGDDSQAYGYAAAFGMGKTCEEAVVNQLVEITRRAGEAARRDDHDEPDELFYAEQNARLVKNAEEYYRTMFRGRVPSWNLRDRHMVETLDALDRHLGRDGARPRMAVWAHNSHLGDASATEMGEAGEWNVGQLVRAEQQRDAVLIGFSTYQGTVTAASDWGAHVERKRVRPGLSDSYEELFHRAGLERFFVQLRDNTQLDVALSSPRLQRAIGVIYMPETERVSHYFHTRLPRQFDAMIHLDTTGALRPLEPGAGWLEHEAPETFPTGI